MFFGTVSGLLGLLAAIGAAVTVFCTAMIYRSLKPIQRWHNSWVVPNYLALALMTGALWLSALLLLFGAGSRGVTWLTLLAILIAAGLKLAYWHFIDTTASASTVASATGLGGLGAVRLFEAPHTSENYLLKEMGFQIARKHAAKLRRIAILAAFVVPFVSPLYPSSPPDGRPPSLRSLPHPLPRSASSSSDGSSRRGEARRDPLLRQRRGVRRRPNRRLRLVKDFDWQGR